MLDDARELALATEAARRRMLELAALRQRLVLSLFEQGMSVRELATRLDVSPAVVQNALKAARKVRARDDLDRQVGDADAVTG